MIEKRKASASSDEEKHRGIFDEYRKERDNLTGENTEVRSRLSYLEAEIKAAEEAVSSALREKAENEELIVRNEETIENNNAIIGDLFSEMEKVSLTDTQKEQLNSLKEKRANIEEKKNSLNEEIKQDNIRRDELTAEINN